MVYRKPFTPQQRRAAVREYEAFRSNVRELRKAFPPLSGTERASFRSYRDRVRAIGMALLKVDALVDVEELNAKTELARHAMAEYFRIKVLGK